ncbi:MAG: RNA 2',3'-cyclic phosphodiesterase [Pseudomonadales bacterium]
MDISRAFIALPCASQSAALLRAGDCSNSFAQHLRWVASNNLHLTLVFLGGLSATEVQNVCSIIGEVAARFKVFGIRFSKVSLFPAGRRPKVLAALPEESHALHKLQSALAERLQMLGVYQQRRSYQPHVTLARCKQANAVWPPAAIDLGYNVAELHLYQSEQTSTGVQYRSLCRATLSQ